MTYPEDLVDPLDLFALECKSMHLARTMMQLHPSGLYLDLLETMLIVDNIEIPVIIHFILFY